MLRRFNTHTQHIQWGKWRRIRIRWIPAQQETRVRERNPTNFEFSHSTRHAHSENIASVCASTRSAQNCGWVGAKPPSATIPFPSERLFLRSSETVSIIAESCHTGSYTPGFGNKGIFQEVRGFIAGATRGCGGADSAMDEQHQPPPPHPLYAWGKPFDICL